MMLIKSFSVRDSSSIFNYGVLLYSQYALGYQKSAQRCQRIVGSIILNNLSVSCGNFEKKAGDVKPSRVIIKSSKSEVLKVPKTSPKIILIDLNGSSSVMHLDEAEKLARHRGWFLVQVQQNSNTPNLMPKYKLVKKAGIFGGENQKLSKSKEKIKNFVIKSDILENDLHHKVNMMMKCLNKKVAVVVDVINKNDDSKVEEVFTAIKKEVEKNHKIESKVNKNLGLKIKIVPGIVDDENKTEETEHDVIENEEVKENKKRSQEK